MKASALDQMSVVAMASGANLGSVADVFVDTSQLRIEALLLQGSGAQLMLPFGSIESIGADALTVESAAAARPPGDAWAGEHARSLGTIKNLSVINADGTRLGEVRDLEFDTKDGSLTALEIHRGGVLGIGGTSLTIARADIRAIGTDVVTATVQAPAEGGPEPGPEAPAGETKADAAGESRSERQP